MIFRYFKEICLLWRSGVRSFIGFPNYAILRQLKLFIGQGKRWIVDNVTFPLLENHQQNIEFVLQFLLLTNGILIFLALDYLI